VGTSVMSTPLCMKNILYPLISIFLLSISCFAQQSTLKIKWQKCLGGTGDDTPNEIIRLNDGGYIIAGSTTSNNGDVSGNHGGKDAWIVRADSGGQIIWQKTYGGTGNDEAKSIKPTADNGFIFCGLAGSIDGDLTGNAATNNGWLVKIDNIGNIQWQKTYNRDTVLYIGNKVLVNEKMTDML
jgi:hypothetical protein